MIFERNVALTNDTIEKIVKVVLHRKYYKSVAGEINAEEHDENA